MYIVIVGGGKVGYHLAKILIEEEHDVVMIEQNGDMAREIANDLECVVVRGDGTKPSILEEAGVREADAIVALTGQDETNMIVCLMAKQMGAKSVAARLGRIHYEEEVLQRLGLDLVIYPEAAAAGYISELITKPELLDLAFIARGDAEILEIEVKADSKLANKYVKDIEHPQGTAIIALYKGEKLVIPDGGTQIQVGDKILIIAKVDKLKKMKEVMGI